MTPERDVQKHPLIVRVLHWSFAIAMLVMLGSGWRIYNAEPILPFRFPDWATLGGDVQISLAQHNDPGVANAIAWHFAGMWILGTAAILYGVYGLLSGRFRRDWLPIGPRTFVRDAVAAVTFKLEHRLGSYNVVQRTLYWGALAGMFLMIVSGAAIWKPAQLGWLTALFGGFQGARIVHFIGMTGLFLFLVVHVALVILVPKTLQAMILGEASSPRHPSPAE